MIRSVETIDAGRFKLDGGAMFGVVPKTMWNKLNPADEDNMCSWALRCLLIRTDNRNILVDTGMGNKQDEKFRSFFHPHGEGDLIRSLAARKLAPEDITDVILTHLHFDHCGGAVQMLDGKLVPTFPNAKYWSNRTHWEWARVPNERERNSFLKENFIPLEEQNVLHHLPDDGKPVQFAEGITLHYYCGHTEGLYAVEVDCMGQNYLYPADLIPSSFHLPVPYVMAYDVKPLITLSEKKQFLQMALDKKSIIVFEHDPVTEACSVHLDERGKIVAGAKFTL
ncbi:MAG TPA: MBL fold metallo-hydrolase [Saprospiraceae bacterium]|nr:MBL fold metallo-hydrolase [Saprospiraceae bacterium]HMX87882.1 MBL fold metallo-hydrolase [Saprospiraceae bacterium]HMZ39730.1 MBL fold metallo-hydrolase [Saprospiraceae bacterium]HNB30350.1 MBL fold metallo-hydrolase [Saprospiraceae bacterium]HNC36683.1 MBL fold metallo-hydrolase [Saprospiraceae bacterium]